MPHNSSNQGDSPTRGSDPSTRRSTNNYNEKSPSRRRSSRRSISPVATYNSRSGRSRSPKRERQFSPQLSPSARSKRFHRAHESDNGVDRERERGSRHGGKGSEREISKDRSEKRFYRDTIRNESVKHRRDNSGSPTDRRRRSKHKSTSPPEDARNGKHEQHSRGSRHEENDDSIAKMNAAEQDLDTKEKQKPSFELSGKLAAETNRVRGVTLLFTEPSDSKKPDIRWRLYVFKAGEVLNEPLYIHRQSCYLFGRERRVADIPTDHPSCSKQHAVIQFRQIEKEQSDGMLSKKVRPYLMDLGSTNKTFLNDNPIDPQRFYELFEKDTVRFGNSSREYVLLHENSANE